MIRAFLAASAALIASAHAETRFFAEIPDLPLPPGFTQTSPGVSFESERGRIVTVEAAGAANAGVAVRDFYYETLPQLGWSERAEDGAAVFVRGRERLAFFVEHLEGRTRLRAQLAVRPAATD